MWHVIFGALAVHVWYIIPLFILYQLLERSQKNTWIDIVEFILGYVFLTLLHVSEDARSVLRV